MLADTSPLQQPRQKTNPAFSKDVRDFFAQRRAGHLSKWLYSTPQFTGDKACGATVWQEVIHAAKNGSPYYVFQKEQEVIQKTSTKIGDLFSKETRLIDLGPGSIDAVQNKILPVLKHTKYSTEYISVDVCNSILNIASNEIKKFFPSITTSKLHHDFLQDSFKYGAPCETEIAALFGLTLYNMAIDPRKPDLPQRLLMSWFKRLQSHFSAQNNYLVITQDINQNPQSLKEAYYALSDHFIRVLYRISRDLNISDGFSPDKFTMEVDFFEKTQACAICFVSNQDMEFFIDNECFSLTKGQRFYFHNAFKFDTKTFLNAAEEAGYKHILTEEKPNNPCILHVLKCTSYPTLV